MKEPSGEERRLGALEADPGRLRMKMWRHRADSVYTWKMPPGHSFRSRLEPYYRQVASNGPGILWERRSGTMLEGGGG